MTAAEPMSTILPGLESLLIVRIASLVIAITIANAFRYKVIIILFHLPSILPEKGQAPEAEFIGGVRRHGSNTPSCCAGSALEEICGRDGLGSTAIKRACVYLSANIGSLSSFPMPEAVLLSSANIRRLSAQQTSCPVRTGFDKHGAPTPQQIRNL